MRRCLAKRQQLSSSIGNRMLAPCGSAVAQSIAALHLRPANVQNNKQLDARILSRDINVRQLICSDGATLNCYGVCLM